MRFDGVRARMSQASYFSEFVKGTGHGRACLPVLEREKRECLKSPSNSHRVHSLYYSHYRVPEGFLSQRYGFESIDFIFPSMGRESAFRWGILSTVKEYILDKNGEKV